MNLQKQFRLSPYALNTQLFQPSWMIKSLGLGFTSMISNFAIPVQHVAEGIYTIVVPSVCVYISLWVEHGCANL